MATMGIDGGAKRLEETQNGAPPSKKARGGCGTPKGTTKGDPRMGSGLRMGIQTWPGNEFQPILTVSVT